MLKTLLNKFYFISFKFIDSFEFKIYLLFVYEDFV
jgi:hypothetical protein